MVVDGVAVVGGGVGTVDPQRGAASTRVAVHCESIDGSNKRF